VLLGLLGLLALFSFFCSLLTRGKYFDPLFLIRLYSVFTQSVQDIFQTIGEQIQPVFSQIAEVFQTIHQAIWTAYLEDGAIYGENNEGMWRWLRERKEIESLREKADRMEREIESLRRFRQKYAERRNH
jgi:hypothetical protein